MPLRPGPRAVDVSTEQDGNLIKDIIRPGLGHEYPPVGAVVYTHYDGKHEDGSRYDASRLRGLVFAFTLGVGELVTN